MSLKELWLWQARGLHEPLGISSKIAIHLTFPSTKKIMQALIWHCRKKKGGQRSIIHGATHQNDPNRPHRAAAPHEPPLPQLLGAHGPK